MLYTAGDPSRRIILITQTPLGVEMTYLLLSWSKRICSTSSSEIPLGLTVPLSRPSWMLNPLLNLTPSELPFGHYLGDTGAEAEPKYTPCRFSALLLRIPVKPSVKLSVANAPSLTAARLTPNP